MAQQEPAQASQQARAFAVALAELARTERLLIALDFDGTLSPLVDSASEARVLPEAAEALDTLKKLPNTWVAYVSGRPLESLVRIAMADDDVLLIGSHGDEVRLGNRVQELGLADEERRRLTALDSALTALIEATPDSMLEHKPVGLGVHTRLVDPAAVPALHEAARAAADAIGGFVVREGKDILEFTVRDATKGEGVERLRTYTNASAVLYAGDDVTDEDAFVVMRERDLGVKVGDGDTAAQYRVADPHAVGVMLTLLAGAREQWATRP
ncbi:trehalose-phosphatase [Rathayibacter soli]|uniref:trehalose-phosphatase n=1 Tax=Rathayibacter soli TaxID=3144168 RepID=UPI0027E3C3D2|nr:trehalose-phosphatase [Glaciibacter superstes]